MRPCPGLCASARDQHPAAWRPPTSLSLPLALRIAMDSSARRRLVLMLACLAGVLVTVVTTNWIVNPYGVWRTTVVPRAYRLTDAAAYESGERLSTPYRIRAERPNT